MQEYKVKFYQKSSNGIMPVKEYLSKLSTKEYTKAYRYIEYLRLSNGYLEEPYSKHIKGKIRELRVDYFHNKHRLFYFTFLDKKIIILHAFNKKSKKTPIKELNKAKQYYNDVITNKYLYE